jgi:hypothetical protein
VCCDTHKHTHTHTQHEVLSSQKEKEILSFATTWMNLHYIMLSEEKPNAERQMLCNLIYRT